VIIERSEYWDHDAVSSSKLGDYAVSPYHYYKAHVAKTTPRKDSASLRGGRAFHARVLEPDTFDERFPLFLGDKRTNAAKAEYAEMEARASALDGCVIRDRDELDAMAAAIRENEWATKLVDSLVHVELPIVFTCSTTGVQCKARLDGLSQFRGANIIVDLKRIKDAPTEPVIEKAIANYGMHRQAAMYMAAAEEFLGKRPNDYWLVFVQGEAPYACATYPLDGETLAIGERWRVEMLTDLAMRRESGRWKFQESVRPIGLPEWARKAA
jgi:hypothetical protein